MDTQIETERLRSLASYRILDTAPEVGFDRLTALAADLFDAPMAVVSLLDADRQWFKSRFGIEGQSTPRDISFCTHAVELGPHAVMVVEDAAHDARFVNNPLVTGGPKIGFYAGAVLTGADGLNLGTLCVIDTKARATPDPAELRRLRALADMVVDELELRRSTRLASERQSLLEMAERMSGVGNWRYEVADGSVIWSDEVYRIHGVTRETFDPMLDSAIAFYHEDDQARIEHYLAEAVRTGQGFEFELRIERTDGELRAVVCKADVIMGDKGEVTAICGVFQDVTEQNRILAKVQRSQEKYRFLTDNIDDVICRIKLDGSSSYVSPAIEKLLGVKLSEISGLNALDFIYEPDRPQIARLFKDLKTNAVARTLQYRALHRNGSPVWVETSVKMIDSGPDSVPEMVAVIRDITKRKALEAEMGQARDEAEEHARRAEFAESIAGLGHWRLDAETMTINWSAQMYSIYGLPRDAPLDLTELMGMTHPEDAEAGFIRVQDQLLAGTPDEHSNTRIVRADGTVRHLQGASRVERNANGEVETIVGTVIDITEQKLAEIAIAKSEANFRSLAENSSDIIVRFGRDGLIRYISPACRVLGVDPEEAVGQSIIKLVAPDHMDKSVALMEGIFKGLEVNPDGRRLHRLLDKAGREFWLEGSPKAVRDVDGNVVEVVSVMRDVTATQQAEQALANSEHRYRRLADSAPDIISESDLNGLITYMSPALLAVTGFAPEEMIGRSSFSIMHPDDAHGVIEMCKTVFESKGTIAAWPVEFRARHKAGHEIWLECKPTLVSDPATGRYVGLIDIIRDVSPRKTLEAELRKAQAEAEAAAAVKGEFLANMSHELRTPLTSIIGFTALAVEQPELGDTTRGYVERVATASRALLCTVNDILDFSKLEAGQVTFSPAPVGLAKLTQSTLDLFAPLSGAKDLKLTLETDAPILLIDGDRVRQVLLNLVGNAVKFTDEGSVTLCASYDLDSGTLEVGVSDTGPGLSSEQIDSLFKRFSQIDGSLTRAHGGTGLGLAICKGLVEAMGGEIGVESTLGQGSRFWFRIPAPQALLVPNAIPTGQEAMGLAGLRVLVADDHPANRELARLFLTGLGVEVTEACDGSEAVELSQVTPFDLILMDLRMPGMDGVEAMNAIRGSAGLNDAIPILAFTADADDATIARLATLGFEAVVPKPLNPGALMAAITRALSFEATADFRATA